MEGSGSNENCGDRTRQLNKERNRVEDLIVAAYDAGNSDQRSG